jgi:ubiquitin carboxyl-terminal hydrolase 4/11
MDAVTNYHGLVGLTNLGNTAAINSVVQCLCNTVPLTNYFLLDEYKNEINLTNPLGSKGRLANAYAELVKHIWLGTEPYIVITDFKVKISQKNQRTHRYLTCF